jgi:hypothetical protein
MSLFDIEAAKKRIQGYPPANIANIAKKDQEVPNFRNFRNFRKGCPQNLKTEPGPADAMADDRRYCSECQDLAPDGRCRAARRGEIQASRDYQPVDDTPRRCEGFSPKSADPDQRKGYERWPSKPPLSGDALGAYAAETPRQTQAQGCTCGACYHFRRTEGHPHLGRCGAGLRAPGSGGLWWDDDLHECPRYVSIDDVRVAAEERAAILQYDGGLDRAEADRISGLAGRFYAHLLGSGATTRCCHGPTGRYCAVGQRLRDEYYRAVAEVEKR